ncbi:MAG: hypothetical protein DMG65_16275 [Candidatus Angelobacter sp. Gp1-AA117]|nr:MAG: hypothetical protein DMG65_16275 [Candidatus Angelobacter sp. Gp1-AA117]
MDKRAETPFDNIENAQKYIKLLIEAVTESSQEIDGEISAATESKLERRLQALRMVSYKLEKLEQNLHACSRMLNDLRTLRRLLLEER